MNEERYDAERLSALKASLHDQLLQSQRRIAAHWNNLTTEPAEMTRSQLIMSQVEKGVAIYDGVMTGYKLYKRLRAFGSLFTRKKKGKKS